MNLNEIKLRPVEVRQSAVKCAYACRRKWLLKYRLGIVLRGEQVKAAANLGRIYHKIKQLGPDRIGEAKEWVAQRQRELVRQAEAGEDLDGSIMRLAGMLTELYNMAEVMAKVFWDRYPLPLYLSKVAQEIEVSIPYRDTPISIGGRLDLILRNEEDGSYWIRDDKTTGRTLDTIFGGLAWSIQARIYRLLAMDYVHRLPTKLQQGIVRGFIMDGMVKPGIKLCKKDEKNGKEWGVTPEEAYLRRVRDWYEEKEQLGEDMILSKALIYTEDMWPPELVRVMDEFIKMDCAGITDIDYFFPRDVTRQACYQYETKCEYHDLCETCPKNWDDLFERKYKFTDEPTQK